MTSIWTNSINELQTLFPVLDHDIYTDVLIIGGGMAGVLLAYMLKEKGVSNILVEAKRIGSGNTKNTTGKITAQHGLIYANLIRKFGVEKARMYFEANTLAIDKFHSIAQMVPCDFEHKTAYVYNIDRALNIDLEVNAYSKLGITPVFPGKSHLPFKVAGILGMPYQAQFNPLKLLMGISKNLEIYENTFVTSIKDNIAMTEKAKIHAKHIILATHYPMKNIPGLYFMKMYQHRSYAIAIENAPSIDGMYIDEKEDGLSFRNYEKMLIIGGGDHRTGKKGGGYQELQKVIKNAYPNATETFRWAAQDCMTLDQMPYIGQHQANTSQLYVATGFNKWGMSGSMVAAQILTDIIHSGKSEWLELFSPQRSMLRGQLFLNIAHSLVGLMQFGKRCPHMGCALKWNAVEKTWDCPCHGSRFEHCGQLIDNPAKRGINVK